MTLRITITNKNRRKRGDTPLPGRGVPLHSLLSEELRPLQISRLTRAKTLTYCSLLYEKNSARASHNIEY